MHTPSQHLDVRKEDFKSEITIVAVNGAAGLLLTYQSKIVICSQPWYTKQTKYLWIFMPAANSDSFYGYYPFIIVFTRLLTFLFNEKSWESNLAGRLQYHWHQGWIQPYLKKGSNPGEKGMEGTPICSKLFIVSIQTHSTYKRGSIPQIPPFPLSTGPGFATRFMLIQNMVEEEECSEHE